MVFSGVVRVFMNDQGIWRIRTDDVPREIWNHWPASRYEKKNVARIFLQC